MIFDPMFGGYNLYLDFGVAMEYFLHVKDNE
jgi:hypothetical protein